MMSSNPETTQNRGINHAFDGRVILPRTDVHRYMMGCVDLQERKCVTEWNKIQKLKKFDRISGYVGDENKKAKHGAAKMALVTSSQK